MKKIPIPKKIEAIIAIAISIISLVNLEDTAPAFI